MLKKFKVLNNKISSHIIILGYMGCGKSSIANLLSKKINIPHIDLDNEIEKIKKSKISEIYNSIGEIKFRNIEKKTLINVLKSKKVSIISLGGGTPCYFDNMNLINSITQNVFFINCKVETLVERLFNEKNQRPIISHIESKEKMSEFISKHIFERINYYNKARIKIDADKKNLIDICNEITKVFN